MRCRSAPGWPTALLLFCPLILFLLRLPFAAAAYANTTTTNTNNTTTAAAANTVIYNLTVGWVHSNPDNQYRRPTIGVNGAWPPPTIRVDVGDRLVVHLHNALGNQSTSLHFHGLFLENATHMDGAVQVSQCALPPNRTMTYNFTVNQPGTYWYHSHVSAQYPDGLRAPLIVHDPHAPFEYDEERVLTLSDWYHDPMPDLVRGFLTKGNPTGAEPVPRAALLNDTQNLTVPVVPGRTYLLRLVNVGAFAGQYLWFEGHNVTVVEVDGVYTRPQPAAMLYLTAAQRYSVLLTALTGAAATTRNYAFVASMDASMFDTVPPDLNYNATGWLVYDDSQPKGAPALLAGGAGDDGGYAPLDDATLVPHDALPLLGDPDVTVTLDVVMANRADGANYAFFNNVTYRAPRVPTLYTVLSSPAALAADRRIYGTYTQTTVLPRRGQIVQLVVNNRDAGRHPFHLHGHNFQIAYRSATDGGTYSNHDDGDGSDGGDPSSNGTTTTTLPFAATPIRRDSLLVYPNGFVVLRFRADNPGVWLFHCHIEWHLSSGLVATFVEAPAALREQQQALGPLPADHLAACAAGGVSTAGNAAGNTVDFLNLKGENAPPPALPDGFTPRGIVALVFSCVSGIAGVGVVAWYGLVAAGDDQASVDPSSDGGLPEARVAPGVEAPGVHAQQRNSPSTHLPTGTRRVAFVGKAGEPNRNGIIAPEM
ncbi:multicopper oxidase [Niveomyces insectorum RCEF 264]|uniref:Multicopper oxidase n=1 Tax=Niveomyces insectorum RCEF 264 TaxID=1081102 RepID=A0A162MR03_9HYPO|nr:multicopper oxidase [Niveomyces insectorum RCEF 264]